MKKVKEVLLVLLGAAVAYICFAIPDDEEDERKKR